MSYSDKIETLIVIGVWLELGVGILVAWMTWQIMTNKQRQRIARWLSPLLKSLNIREEK